MSAPVPFEQRLHACPLLDATLHPLIVEVLEPRQLLRIDQLPKQQHGRRGCVGDDAEVSLTKRPPPLVVQASADDESDGGSRPWSSRAEPSPERTCFPVGSRRLTPHEPCRAAAQLPACCGRSIQWMRRARDSSKWSLWSEDSVLSIASKGSVLSVASVGSVLSVGSIASAGSLLSIGSCLSIGSIMSFMSRWSVMKPEVSRDRSRH